MSLLTLFRNKSSHPDVGVVAAIRGESVGEVTRRFGDSLKDVPRRFSKRIPAMRGVRFLETGIEGDLAYVVLENRRLFYGFRSQPNHERMFHYVSDQLDPNITPETFLTALDVVHRYLSDFCCLPDEMLPPRGGTIVEAGAFLGHRTIRFADEMLGGRGSVLAVEIMPENARVLKKNVAANKLESVISVEQAGVWNTPGSAQVTGKGRQRFSLVGMDKLANGRSEQVRVDTLDCLLERWGRLPVDLMFVNVNGAEIEAIDGINDRAGQVRGLVVASPYSRNGESTTPVIRTLLQEKGYVLLESENPHRVIARLG